MSHPPLADPPLPPPPTASAAPALSVDGYAEVRPDAREKQPPGRVMAHVIYGVQCFAFVGGTGGFVGMILAALCRAGAKGTWLESHFTWQVTTFWKSLGWYILGGVAILVAASQGEAFIRPTAFAVQIAVGAWSIGRLAKGWTRLWYGEPIEDEG